jgi:PAS domain S-box-containing protein
MELPLPAHALMTAVVESSEDAIVTKDLNGVITSWNAGAERLFGYTADEAIGKSVTILIPEGRPDEEPNILRRIRSGLRVDHYETIRAHKNGTLIDISLTVSPLKDKDGNIVGASKIARDITERKRVEAELRKVQNELALANDELEDRVRKRTAELEAATVALLKDMEARKRLEAQLRETQKLESIGILAGGVAHDFNNLLNIIRGYTCFLRQSCSDDTLVRPLEVIDETIERGASVVRQMLTLARKTEAHQEWIDLKEILEKHAQLLKETLPKTIDISLSITPELPALLSDPTQIDQMLLNLSLNARDAMPEGGKLYIETGTATGADLKEHSALVLDFDQYVYVVIQDSGIGMDENTKSRIFDPFFTTKGPLNGSGLGLWVVYGIVANHGGFIDVTSAPRKGTTFRIYLPVRERAKEPVKRSPKPSDGNGPSGDTRNQTILFVDDEVHQLDLMQMILEREGYKVLRAADGEEAVEAHAQNKGCISAVVLDLGLPKLGGWEALEKMRDTDPDVRAILASGFISPELEAELKRGSISGVVMKPYRMEDILEKISTAISEPTNRQASRRIAANRNDKG